MSSKAPTPDFKGTPQTDGSRFLVGVSTIVESVTTWGPGRTLIYPWESKSPQLPPVSATNR